MDLFIISIRVNLFSQLIKLTVGSMNQNCVMFGIMIDNSSLTQSQRQTELSAGEVGKLFL